MFCRKFVLKREEKIGIPDTDGTKSAQVKKVKEHTFSGKKHIRKEWFFGLSRSEEK